MKNTVLVITFLITGATCALAYFQNTKADRAVSELNEERYARMVAEEDLLKAAQDLERLTKEMDSLKSQLKNHEKLLKQTQSINSDLQAQLKKAESVKASLENKISEMTKQLSSVSSAATGDI